MSCDEDYDAKHLEALKRIEAASDEIKETFKSIARDLAPAGLELVQFALGERCAWFFVDYGPSRSQVTMPLAVYARLHRGYERSAPMDDEWMRITPSEFRRRLTAEIAAKRSAE